MCVLKSCLKLPLNMRCMFGTRCHNKIQQPVQWQRRKDRDSNATRKKTHNFSINSNITWIQSFGRRLHYDHVRAPHLDIHQCGGREFNLWIKQTFTDCFVLFMPASISRQTIVLSFSILQFNRFSLREPHNFLNPLRERQYRTCAMCAPCGCVISFSKSRTKIHFKIKSHTDNVSKSAIQCTACNHIVIRT